MTEGLQAYNSLLGWVRRVSLPYTSITLVAIGAVALLSLAFNELIVEARQAQGEKERWYIGFMIFLGIWVIITFSRFTEEE